MNDIASPTDVVNFEVSKEQLTSFFVHHLGRKRELKYSEAVDFVLSIDDIKQLFHLFSQKVANDENKKLDFFEIEVFYNDNTSKKFYDFDSLESDFGFKNSVPLAVYINWVVLVKFASSDTIETQRVNVYFGAADGSTGYLEINIEHTNNIWADEIQGLLSSYLNKIKKPANKALIKFQTIKNFVYGTGFLMFFLTLMLLFLSISGPVNNLLFGETSYRAEIQSRGINTFYLDDVERAILDTKIPSTDKTLILKIIDGYYGDERKRYISNVTSNKSIIAAITKHQEYLDEAFLVMGELDAKKTEREEFFLKILLFLVSLMAFSAVLFAFLSVYSRYYNNYYSMKSFINLTQNSELECTEYYRKKNKLTFYSISGVLFAVLTGLLTTVIVEIIKIKI